MNIKKRKVILIIRDGWGYNEKKEGNFLLPEFTPIDSELRKNYPNTLLDASGNAVGLPEGYQGNSEVGHMTIGSGRIILQSLTKINQAIAGGEFFRIVEFAKAIDKCKKNKTHLHLMGLLQTEGVHSHTGHLFALLELCKIKGFFDVYIHAFTDGRDAPVNDGINQIKALENKLRELGFGIIATISGRYYTMDRDQRWDRTKTAYDCIVEGKGKSYEDAGQAVRDCYTNNETDEFIRPCKNISYNGVGKGDAIIFFNFRTDRTRQLTKSIVDKKFHGWNRKPLGVYFVCMTQYYSPMNAKVAFKDKKLINLLGEVISKKGLKQLRISETEKYAHVTFFFNGQNEKPNKKEDRFLMPSPRVATYDLAPRMSANLIADKIVEEIKKDKYDFIVTNLVNCDMVGHTGKREAIISAVKTVDECVGKIAEAGRNNGYAVLIFADHGNAENKQGETSTSHTKNPVPFILVSNEEELKKVKLKKDGGLSDIAPTVLDILGIKKPKEMTGESLVEN